MDKLREKMTEMVKDHDIELLNSLMNALLGRFGNLNGSDGILVEDVRDEIVDVCDDYINELAN